MAFLKVLGIVLGIIFVVGCVAIIVVNCVSIIKTLKEKKKNKSLDKDRR